ncbi:MAG TPA: helix-turn-helix domain-containing protein [Gemmatimonadota bacterium]|nr:helix-turn-helix domain-containing protein [Gemmatimonadota bacterium]
MLATERSVRVPETERLKDKDKEPVFLRIGDAARLLGVSISTLRRLEKNGRLGEYGVRVYYTPTRRRRYKKAEIIEALERSAHG